MAGIHIHPTAPLAERVLLPGDPGRALLLATRLLSEPRMFNHHRGLWGYTGAAADGEPLTVQATGMGGPSTAIVVEELITLGARRLIRVGTCGGIDPALPLGSLVVAPRALADDGASRALGADEVTEADPELTAALVGAAGGAAVGPIVSTDLFYGPDPEAEAATLHRWRSAGALAVEMEAATLYTVARLRGARAGTVCAVSDLLDGEAERARITAEELEDAAVRLGRTAIAALS